MDDEELSDAVIQGDLPNMEPEDGQGLRDCAHGEDKVCSNQHAEEEVRGFREAAFCNNDKDEEVIPQHRRTIRRGWKSTCAGPQGQGCPASGRLYD